MVEPKGLESMFGCFETFCGNQESLRAAPDVIQPTKTQRGLVVLPPIDKKECEQTWCEEIKTTEACDDNASNGTDSTSEASLFASLSDSSSKEDNQSEETTQRNKAGEESSVGSTNATFLGATCDTKSASENEGANDTPKNTMKIPQEDDDAQRELETAVNKTALKETEGAEEYQLDEIPAPAKGRSIFPEEARESETNGQARSLSSNYTKATSSINKISKSVRKASGEIRKTKRMFRTFTSSIKSLQNEVQSVIG